ncbi:hypothetical protein HPB48_012225 [Haemaphysalis longicornis]|uniref:Uncharacterized protein n=1 Tax=Haemaphysalis longicornis TaxID=44386 RepID=A0A9J6GAM4_HAELO|nr:hypothetical protein HPB48_012225 [Haemaphysalis longicornis]
MKASKYFFRFSFRSPRFITRTAREDFEYKGVRYKAGLNIMSLTLLVHKDPAAWSEPERFDSDR